MVGMPKFLTNYPLKVFIAEVRGNAIRWDSDKARVVKDGNTKSFELQRRRPDRIPIAKFDQMQINTKGKSVLMLLSPALGKYVPMTVNIQKEMLSAAVEDSDMAFWSMLELRRIDELYKHAQTWWEKYASYVMLALTGSILLFTVIYITDALQQIAASANAGAQSLATAYDKMALLLSKG